MKFFKQICVKKKTEAAKNGFLLSRLKTFMVLQC
jgi:hypothetical protein